MPMITALPLSVLAALALVVLAACYQTALEYIAEWWDRRKYRRELLSEYDYWHDKALSYTDFGIAGEKKSKAVACMLVLRNELRRLERGEENE